MPDNKIFVSRPYYQGLGLGLETWWPRSWSRDLGAKVLVLKPGGQGLGPELFSKVLITSLLLSQISPLFSKNSPAFYIISVYFVPPTLTMMHLCIIQCTYWTPLVMRTINALSAN